MCGIIGLSARNLDGLAAANDLLAHRGPDDFGVFTDHAAGVGLGHRRLSIVDLSPSGHQPMLSVDGRVVLVYNGEIYNYRELHAELEKRGVIFRGCSDTEVLLNLYLAEGEGMLSRLNGIFAFALWDSRKQALLVARDALGVKPLYYVALDGHFAFASEIKALLKLVPEARELDIASLHRYLSLLWCPGAGTPLKAVRKLAPGEAMWVRAWKIERRWTWYQLPAFRGASADLDEKSALAGTASHLRQAVQRQMVADVPVGAFLSGGLDSSAIVAFAREINPEIYCFTIESVGGQEAGETDDLPYARRVASHLGVPLEVVRIEAARMVNDLEWMVAQMDEPLADPASLNVFYISQLARQHGIKVLLSGAGGDDLFTGYRRHRAVQAERYWNWLPRLARTGLGCLTGRLDQRSAIGRRLRKLFNGAALEGDARLVNYFIWAGRDDLLPLYTPGFRAAMSDAAAGAPMLEFLAEMPSSVEPLDRMLALEQRFFLADHNLIYTDKMSMAAGVEVRVPFLDMDLVEFAQRIPLRFKQRGQEGKWVLKKAMEPYLPKEVIYRPKTGFGAPLRRWMRFELRELLGDLLSVESLKRRGLFEPAAVQRLITANDSGKADASYTLLSLLCIEIWCRIYLDRNEKRTT
ncbi:MAG: asparagine synthase (glutamine-hydrolyzing) [Xanthomonadales bacterium]|nr:asparagine synthase (glutamine-hydrolyzing) [Xanthomonadales bacterium]